MDEAQVKFNLVVKTEIGVGTIIGQFIDDKSKVVIQFSRNKITGNTKNATKLTELVWVFPVKDIQPL